MTHTGGLIPVLILLAAFASPAWSQSEGELAKKTQNPVSDLTSVPFQFNWSTGGPFDDRALYNLNFQPVFPIPIGKSLNLIFRPVVPILNIPVVGSVGPSGVGERSTGIGDIQTQFFFTPQGAGTFVWGAGPVLSLPTATNDLARTGALGLGPNVVLLSTEGKVVTGVLANHMWKVSGTEGSAFNRTFVQPFFNYNLPEAWALNTAPAITADWELAEGDEWTVPVGLGISKVTALGSRPLSLALAYYHNAVRPAGAAEDTYRIQATFLFPRKG